MEAAMLAMLSVKIEDVLHDYRPFLVIYKDGKLQRFVGTDTVDAGFDSVTGVDSKDVVICSETGVSARLYKPQNLEGKAPLVVYFHGGGFCVETAMSPVYHNYLNALSSKSGVIVVSVDHRRAPEHPLPAAYDDSWLAVNWIAGGSNGEPWLKNHADFSRVYLAGDSAGANIAHHMAKRLGKENKKNHPSIITLNGVVLVHPYFWGKERIGSENMKAKTGAGLAGKLWELVCPGSSGLDDPMINPGMDPELGEMGGERVLVCVAEHDALRDRGFYYEQALVKSGWKGSVKVVETAGENHVFHLLNSASENAAALMDRIVEFIKQS